MVTTGRESWYGDNIFCKGFDLGMNGELGIIRVMTLIVQSALE